MEFNFVDLKFTIKTANEKILSHRLPRAAGEYADTCRQLACRDLSRDCFQCSLNSSCEWFFVFGQKLSSDPDALRRHQKPSLPFIFSFFQPSDGSQARTGLLEYRMVVVGQAIAALEMLLTGLRQLLVRMDKTLNCGLNRVFSCDHQGNSFPLNNEGRFADAENLMVMSAEDIFNKCPWDCKNVTIRLLSPLKLFSQGRQLRHFDFTVFACSLMRRISSLAYYYCGYEFDCDFKSLSDAAKRVVCVEDQFSVEKGEDWKTSGVGGYGCFSANFGGLLPILMFGTYIHVGKNAPFGMGAYSVEIS